MICPDCGKWCDDQFDIDLVSDPDIGCCIDCYNEYMEARYPGHPDKKVRV